MATHDVLHITIAFVRSDDGGYIAYVKELPGCIAQGDTEEEAKKNILDVTQAYIATMWEHRFGWDSGARPTGLVLKEETFRVRPELVLV